MPSLGVPELIIILLLVVLLFGATRLPRTGRALGEAIANFRGAFQGRSDTRGEE